MGTSIGVEGAGANAMVSSEDDIGMIKGLGTNGLDEGVGTDVIGAKQSSGSKQIA